MIGIEQMVKRQRVLADFGEFALRSEDLTEVLTEACRLVSVALATDLAKVLEIEQDGDNSVLLVRAGVGWQPGVVGVVRLPMGEHSSETYAIKQAEPLVMADISKEKRFDIPAFMIEAGVCGIVNVPIFLPGGKPYGLLQVDSREAWDPQEEDVAFLRTYATILGPVIDRLHKVHALREALDKNVTLLHELQHRIKNNIGAITGLVHMRMRKTTSQEARDELGIVGERIETLRLVHEHVYAARNSDRLSLRQYATELLEGLLTLHQDVPVRLDLKIDDLVVPTDVAIPLGLILNEFTTNSMKYAFHGMDQSDRLIALEAYKRDDRLWIKISDNGKGLPPEAKESRPGHGTGMALIAGLARQIRAKPDWSSEYGTALCLEFAHR